MVKKLLLSAVLVALASHCGSSTGNSPGPDAGPDGGVQFVLNISNYEVWCAILENGVSYSTATQFPAGTVVTLSATPLTGYVWGYWTGTDADDGGIDTDMATTVTMDSERNVLACCPLRGMGCP